MKDNELLDMVERVTAGEHLPDDGIGAFAGQLADAAPRPRDGFEQELEERLMMNNARINRLRLLRPLRMTLIAAALLLVFAVIAYAVDSVVQQVIDWDAGLRAVEGQPLNLSQTVDGYTVNLQWAHADANRVSIGYSISGLEGVEYTNLMPGGTLSLSDSAGNLFPSAGGIGNAIEDGVGGNVSWFDSTSLETLPDVLDLHLEMDIEVSTAAARTRTPEDPDAWFEEPIGPFVFDFSLQTGEQRVIDVQETMTESGVPVTLQRLVISESQTRVEVCFDDPDPAFDEWLPVVWLFVNGRDLITEGQTGVGGGRIEGTNCHFNAYNLALVEETGEWRVEVRQLIGMGSSPRIEDEQIPTLEAAGAVIHEDENGQTAIEMPEGGWEAAGFEQRINGPWVFTVQVE
jgi:hypothetical protein